MATDFFESQDRARRNSGRLLLLLALAVTLIIALVYLVVGVFVMSVQHYGDDRSAQMDWSGLWNLELVLAVGLGILAIVTLGSLFKIWMLRGGGAVIAEALGGQLISAQTTDPAERRLLNVVEEMAIASGTPVPPVYLLPEDSINAFAAGYSPGDAVIGVTRGCARLLSRDELQGVMAHEFSHILNGDMRLNIRLIGVIHGILIIGIIGYYVLRLAAASRSTSRRREGNPLPFILLGLALLVIGYVGIFFGNLIKAAVSRQREFMADAAAIQFTRNPQGIAGALKKIGGYVHGSRLQSPAAAEASHLFFSQGLSFSLKALFATHPPLPVRIRRIDPTWDGQFPPVERPMGAEPSSEAPRSMAQLVADVRSPRQSHAAVGPDSLRHAVSQVGHINAATIEYASQVLEGLPKSVAEAAHEPYGARAVVYALLINRDPRPRQAQMQRLERHADRGVYDLTLKLLKPVAHIEPQSRLPLVSLALPALRQLTAAQYTAFKQNMLELIKADERLEVFEWALHQVIEHHLEPVHDPRRRATVKYASLKHVADSCASLLSTLAYAGHRNPQAAQRAFQQGLAELQLAELKLRPLEECRLAALGKALEELNALAARPKRKLLSACAVCISADQQVTAEENELLRAIADSLDCPMPPLLVGSSEV